MKNRQIFSGNKNEKNFLYAKLKKSAIEKRQMPSREK